MKTYLLKFNLIICILLAIPCIGQVTVTIANMSYASGGNINSGEVIEVPYNDNVRIFFSVNLSKPNNQVVGNSTLRIFIENPYGSDIQIGSNETIFGGWGTFTTSSKDVTIESGQLSNQDGYLYAEFESSSGIKYKSSNWPIQVLEEPEDPIANNTITGNQTINQGDMASTISGTTPTGGNGQYSYKWEKKTTGGWSTISGATSKNYSPGVLSQTTQFRRVVSSGSVSDNTSNVVTKSVVIYPPVSNNVISYYQGSTTIIGSTPSGGNGTYTYQWYIWPVFAYQLGADPQPYPNYNPSPNAKDLHNVPIANS